MRRYGIPLTICGRHLYNAHILQDRYLATLVSLVFALGVYGKSISDSGSVRLMPLTFSFNALQFSLIIFNMTLVKPLYRVLEWAYAVRSMERV